MANCTKILLLPRTENSITPSGARLATVVLAQHVRVENLLLSTCWWHGTQVCTSLGQLAFLRLEKLFLSKGIKHTAMQAKTFWHEISKIKIWAGVHLSSLDEATVRSRLCRQVGEGWVLSAASGLHPGLSSYPVNSPQHPLVDLLWWPPLKCTCVQAVKCACFYVLQTWASSRSGLLLISPRLFPGLVPHFRRDDGMGMPTWLECSVS